MELIDCLKSFDFAWEAASIDRLLSTKPREKKLIAIFVNLCQSKTSFFSVFFHPFPQVSNVFLRNSRKYAKDSNFSNIYSMAINENHSQSLPIKSNLCESKQSSIWFFSHLEKSLIMNDSTKSWELVESFRFWTKIWFFLILQRVNWQGDTLTFIYLLTLPLGSSGVHPFLNIISGLRFYDFIRNDCALAEWWSFCLNDWSNVSCWFV